MTMHLSVARQALAWLAILAACVVLVVAVLLPRVAGATPYTVLTSSMEPDLPAGTLVVTKPVATGDIEVGSVITYQLESGKREVVTHRVVGQGISTEGRIVLRTQGDANAGPDAAWVRPVQVKGEVWYSVPYLGYVNSVLTGTERQWAVYGVAVLLLGYAGATWGSALRDRRRQEVSRVAHGGRHASAA